MTLRLLPAIDAHAHVETSIAASDLKALQTVVFAVTREPKEWAAAAARKDAYTVWGLGCHPSVEAGHLAFDADRLHAGLARVPLIGEVGLDRKSRVPMGRQLATFKACLEVAAARPRLISVHSVGAADGVLDCIEAQPPAAAILHWWRGNDSQTRRALELGCFFSLNGAELRSPKVLDLLPRDRVLTETDFPHTRRQDVAAQAPGAVDAIEDALAAQWGLELGDFRRQLWANLGSLCERSGVTDLLPPAIRATIDAAVPPAAIRTEPV